MTKYKTIRASQLETGDWLGFDNPRYNRRIVAIERAREGQILIRHDFGNGGEPATSFYHPNEFVQII